MKNSKEKQFLLHRNEMPNGILYSNDYKYFVVNYEFNGRPFVFLDREAQISVMRFIKERAKFDCVPIISDGELDEYIAFGFFEEKNIIFRSSVDSFQLEVFEVYSDIWAVLKYIIDRISERFDGELASAGQNPGAGMGRGER